MRGTPEEEATRWLRQAKADLRWADHLADVGGYHIACFLAQQVAEKALKAVLYAEGREIVLGHSVERLMTEIRDAVPGLAIENRWAELDGFYVPTRYPNSIPDSIPADVYTDIAARRAVDMAKAVVETVTRHLAS